MRRPLRAALAASALFTVSTLGCAPPSYYAWGAYDEVLYRHYKHPQDHAEFTAGLRAVMLAAQQEGRRVPPGLYAEYGYALYEEGNLAEAVVYFQKERDLWPESRVLMETMIRNAQRQAGQRPPATSPGAAAKEGP